MNTTTTQNLDWAVVGPGGNILSTHATRSEAGEACKKYPGVDFLRPKVRRIQWTGSRPIEWGPNQT